MRCDGRFIRNHRWPQQETSLHTLQRLLTEEVWEIDAPMGPVGVLKSAPRKGKQTVFQLVHRVNVPPTVLLQIFHSAPPGTKLVISLRATAFQILFCTSAESFFKSTMSGRVSSPTLLEPVTVGSRLQPCWNQSRLQPCSNQSQSGLVSYPAGTVRFTRKQPSAGPASKVLWRTISKKKEND